MTDEPTADDEVVLEEIDGMDVFNVLAFFIGLNIQKVFYDVLSRCEVEALDDTELRESMLVVAAEAYDAAVADCRADLAEVVPEED